MFPVKFALGVIPESMRATPTVEPVSDVELATRRQPERLAKRARRERRDHRHRRRKGQRTRAGVRSRQLRHHRNGHDRIDVRVDGAIERDGRDVGIVGELAHVRAVNFGQQRIDGRVLGLNHVAVVLEATAHLGAIAWLQRDDDVLGWRTGARAPRSTRWSIFGDCLLAAVCASAPVAGTIRPRAVSPQERDVAG